MNGFWSTRTVFIILNQIITPQLPRSVQQQVGRSLAIGFIRSKVALPEVKREFITMGPVMSSTILWRWERIQLEQSMGFTTTVNKQHHSHSIVFPLPVKEERAVVFTMIIFSHLAIYMETSSKNLRAGTGSGVNHTCITLIFRLASSQL